MRIAVGCLILGMLAGNQAGRAAEVPPRPNFVIMIADDMAWDDCGAYGHPHIRTPNLDRLAREGMRFELAFLTCSSCSPSRSSILTGRYPHATGAAELHQPLPAEQVMLTEPLRKVGYFTAAAGKWHLGTAAKAKFDQVREGGGEGATGYWIPLLRERPKDKPFFLWLASTDPHRGYSPNAIPQPHTAADAVVPPFLPDVEETRRDLALYYDEITRFDAAVGQVLEELDRQRLGEQTVVLVMSDNGRPFPRCKTTVYDSGVRMPLVVRYPRLVGAGTVCRRLVSSVDLAPTLLELAGLEPLASFQGRSFAALLRDPEATIRSHVFAEHNWHDYMAFERAVRSERWLYIFNGVPQVPGTPPADAVRSLTFRKMRQLRDEGKLPPEQMGCFIVPRPKEELYDLAQDPFALKNLAADPQHAAPLAELRNALAQWQQQTGDQMPKQLTPDKYDRELGTPLPPK